MDDSSLDFRALAENLPILCWIANPDGFIVWYNRRWYQYTGSTPAEMEGWGWQSVHDPAELPGVLKAWRASISTGAPFEMIFPLRSAEGAFRPFLTRVVPARDAAGVVTAWYGVNTDISDQTIAERELRERKIAEEGLLRAKADAEAARRDAEQASAAKSEFLASMSHEIRTPLNAIIGYSDLLLEKYPAVAGLSRELALIQNSGSALLTIVNDILDFSRIEAGRIRLDLVAFSPHTLIDNVASMLATFAEEKGVKIRREIDPRLPPFLIGDDNRLRQIVLNLLNNAIKFAGQGSVSVAIEAEGVSADHVHLRILVRDKGIGIPIEHQKRLFNRFSQVDGTITRRFGGTGLGLAICKQLVDLMGGTIGVDSREGAGATFWVRLELPVAQAPDALPAPQAALQSEAASTVSILLVEDVPVNQDLAKAVLERWGHKVDVASDGAEAVELVRRTRYDLVLMDVQMPVMDGIAATKAIRSADHGNAKVPIVAMTANVLPQQILALKAAGMNDHVGKPFKAAGLQAVIGRWASKQGDPPKHAPSRGA